MSGFASVKNGQKGGRPRYSNNNKIQIPDIEIVILTPEQ